MNVDSIVTAKRLIGGKDFDSIDRPVIGIRDGVIRFVESGTTGHTAQERIDLPNLHLLPGFIDTHVHLIFGGEDRDYERVMARDNNGVMLLRASRNAVSYLAAGVTTIRDLGDRDGILVSLREAINAGVIPGPRVQVSGPPLTITGGHFHFCNGEVDGEEEIRKKIRSLHKQGVDVIKIMATGGTTRGSVRRKPAFTKGEMRIIVEEAHKLGKPTAAHVHCTAGIENCLDAGVDSLEHVGFFSDDGLLEIEERLIERMAKQGTTACITLKNSYVGIQRLATSDREADKKRHRELIIEAENRLETLKVCRAYGVHLSAGTDSIWEHGDYHIIVELMAETGIPMMEVFKIATIESAKALRLEEHIGTVEAGKFADIIGFEHDPLESIEHVKAPCFVMKGGVRVDTNGDPICAGD